MHSEVLQFKDMGADTWQAALDLSCHFETHLKEQEKKSWVWLCDYTCNPSSWEAGGQEFKDRTTEPMGWWVDGSMLRNALKDKCNEM